jgi:hypothetical protein
MFGLTKVLPFLGKRRCVFPLQGRSNIRDSSTPTGPLPESDDMRQHNGSLLPKAESEHSKVIENVKKQLQEQSKRLREESEKRRKQNHSR